MSKEEYWKKLCEKNPAFKNRDSVKIPVNSIKKIAFQAYELGKKSDPLKGTIFEHSPFFGGGK